MPEVGVVLQIEPKLPMDIVARIMDAVLQSPMKQISVTALKPKFLPPITVATSVRGVL